MRRSSADPGSVCGVIEKLDAFGTELRYTGDFMIFGIKESLAKGQDCSDNLELAIEMCEVNV